MQRIHTEEQNQYIIPKIHSTYASTFKSVMKREWKVNVQTMHIIGNDYIRDERASRQFCTNAMLHSVGFPYFVHSTSSCRLPWHRWHWVHNRENLSSRVERWDICRIRVGCQTQVLMGNDMRTYIRMYIITQVLCQYGGYHMQYTIIGHKPKKTTVCR
jgi:hypothetical protein